MGSIIGRENSGKDGGKSQDTTTDDLPSIGGSIQQAFRGLGALSF